MTADAAAGSDPLMSAIIRDGQVHVTCGTCGTELVLDADQAARNGTWIGAATDHGWTIRDGGRGESSCPHCYDNTPVERAEVTEAPEPIEDPLDGQEWMSAWRQGYDAGWIHGCRVGAKGGHQ